MFDIGWSELLIIAIVLIVVVGPKDLPPMIRAFGKTMAGFRKMAGDFRAQFDEAMKEADMDDVRQTIADVRNLNPTNSLRDAMNPLRQLGNDIRSDLQKAATPSGPATSAPVDAPDISLSDPEMKLPDAPPAALSSAPSVVAATPVVTQTVPTSEPVGEKPKRSRKTTAKSTQEVEAEAVAAKPKRAPRTISAKADAKKPKVSSIAAMESEPAISPALTDVAAKAATRRTVKVADKKVASATVANPKATRRKPDAAVSAEPAKTARTAKAKKDEA
ncbi:Sec-independent protein translocase protein TatB [Agrobacterium larrymoorei]|uniref:Sec-independent protein translocase protein TatB n=1 Tax=Agrobacterium larrymoorei TaxID=160699 RepID=UPI0030BD849C